MSNKGDKGGAGVNPTINTTSKDRVLMAVPEKCIGCRLCEMVCSLNKDRRLQPLQAHIYVAEGEEGIFFPVKCDQCKDAPCIAACERKAIFRNKKTGAIAIDRWGCNQCGLCLAACPFGLISYGAKSAQKCELCKGDPLCADICPTGALVYVNRDEISSAVSKI